MNNLFDKDITLNEPDHKYFLKSNPEINFQSVTTISSQYFEPFDKYAVAERLVKTNVKYSGMSIDDLISTWDEARDFGSKVHEEIEIFIKEGIVPEEAVSHHALDWLKRYEAKPEVKIYSEVRIYSKELNMAGTIDILAHDTEKNIYQIIDWKTSKKPISKISFGGKMGISPVTKHLMDCKFVHHSIQLSFYRYLLEKYYGLNMTGQFIGHLNGIDCDIIKANYYKDEVLSILTDQKNQSEK